MNVRIGFFDSGIGGLSVLRHAPGRIPGARYFYVADSAFAPYGEQAVGTVRERMLDESPELDNTRLVDKSYVNLVRMWAEP